MLNFTVGHRRFLSLSSIVLATGLAWIADGRADTEMNIPIPTPRPERPAELKDTGSNQVDAAKKAIILGQGVPADLLDRALQFRTENLGRTFTQEVYVCADKPEGSVRPCDEDKRSRSTREIQLPDHPYMVIIDFRQSSLQERLYLIHLPTGKVERMQVTHGKNSGELYAHRFSNIKDSKQTSLGIYMLGEPYTGGYGNTLRMYGLQGSNDQAYNRDIVMHGAPYAAADFPKTTNYRTNKPYGRLGVSWGCPAISLKNAKKWFSQLQGGALIYHAYPELEAAAQNGREVVGTDPAAEDLTK